MASFIGPVSKEYADSFMAGLNPVMGFGPSTSGMSGSQIANVFGHRRSQDNLRRQLAASAGNGHLPRGSFPGGLGLFGALAQGTRGFRGGNGHLPSGAFAGGYAQPSPFQGVTRQAFIPASIFGVGGGGRPMASAPGLGSVFGGPQRQPMSSTGFQRGQFGPQTMQAGVLSKGHYGGGSYAGASRYDNIPAVTGIPNYGGPGQTGMNLGVGAAAGLGAWGATAGLLSAAGPVTAAGVGATTSLGAVAGLGAYAGPIGALVGAGLAIGVGGKDAYYASGGLHDAIDNTLGRIPVLGGVVDFATDAVQGVFDFFGLGRLFGGNREAKKARNKYMKERAITWKHLQVAQQRRWTNFGIDTNKVRRDQGIQDYFLGTQQGLDWNRWDTEDDISDQAFIRNMGFNNQQFNLGRWRYNALGQLGDNKMWTDTNIANTFANAQLAQNINTMLQRAGLEANSAVAANAISTNLMRRIGAIQDATSDKKGDLARFAYQENQRIEDDLYAASVQLDKTGTIRDMTRVVEGWNEKAKMEKRANEKLFRGDKLQEAAFKNKVAQQQHKAKLMMRGDGAVGTAAQADPIRAQRIGMLAKINGAQSMAAERIQKIMQIGTSLDYVQDSVEKDPANWGQSKKQLQFMLDQLDDL